jgi:hypothetical protein
MTELEKLPWSARAARQPLHARQAHAVRSHQLLSRSAGYKCGYQLGDAVVPQPYTNAMTSASFSTRGRVITSRRGDRLAVNQFSDILDKFPRFQPRKTTLQLHPESSSRVRYSEFATNSICRLDPHSTPGRYVTTGSGAAENDTSKVCPGLALLKSPLRLSHLNSLHR